MLPIAETHAFALDAGSVVWLIVASLLVTGLAWLIPPTRPHALVIGVAVAIIGLLLMLL